MTVDQTYATRKIVATVVKPGDANQVVERMKKALGGGEGSCHDLTSR
jgi:hypothetical protein